MSSSQSSTNDSVGFLIVASAVIVLSAGLMALAWPRVLQAARVQSDRLATEAAQKQGSEAQLDLQLAQWLNPSNQVAAASVAGAQIAAGEPHKALNTLERAGGAGSNTALLALSLKASLEAGNAAAAMSTADKLAKLSSNQANLRFCALAYGVGERQESLTALAPRLTAPEAVQALLAAQLDKVALGRELYATGLVDSAQRLLSSQPSSYERDYVLAQLVFSQGHPKQLAQAETYANHAVAANLTSRSARQLLIRILEAEYKTDLANGQKQLLEQLEVGQP